MGIPLQDGSKVVFYFFFKAVVAVMVVVDDGVLGAQVMLAE